MSTERTRAQVAEADKAPPLRPYLLCLALLLTAGCDSRISPPAPTPEPPRSVGLTRTLFGRPGHRYDLPGGTGTVTDLSETDLGKRLRVERTNGQTVVHLPLAEGEALWGFGQRLDAFNLRGLRFDVWAEDAWNQTATSNFAVPWLVSSRGYGLFINHTGRLHVDLGATQPDELRIVIPEDGVELWAITGTPTEVVSAYSALVGRPQAVPDWTFQPWLSRNSFLSAYEVDRTLGLMEKHGLRVGAVVLEAWEQHLHNFRFETNRYPNPAGWIQRLHQRGYHVICWTTASIWNGDPVTEQARDRGFLIRNADGSEYITRWLENGRKMDFRNPEACAWWRDLHGPLIAMGVDGFKTDGGEHMPDPWFHNVHPHSYQRATLDAYAAAGRTGLTFARAANPLCAGNSTFWGGDQHADWSNLAAVVRGGLSAAWSGFFYWSHDIGGYTGIPTKDLYLRWLQIGAFSPMMQLHGVTPREPWLYDRETVDLTRGYFKVRERLQPYLLDLAREAREHGIPMWRPLPLVYPDDPATWSVGDQFLLGADLLIAPIVGTNNERTVYLPTGRWMDLWNGTTLTGPTQLTVRAGLAITPAYARAESAARWRHLFSDVPQPEATPPLDLQLAGPRNERGLIPDQRYLRAGNPETLAYVIRNHTPVHAEGLLTPQLPVGFTATPARASFKTAPGETSEINFTIFPPADLTPGSYVLHSVCRVGTLTAKTPALTLIQPLDWQILGPFAGGVGSVQPLDGLPPDLTRGQPGAKGNEVHWRQLPQESRAADGYLDLRYLSGDAINHTSYASASFLSPTARRVRLHVGSGDAITVWVNGQEVLRKDVFRNAERDEDTADCSLVGGTNHVVVRLSQSVGPHGFYFRLSDPSRR